MLAGGGYDLGLLLDGDADRAGAADERGTLHHHARRSSACSCTTWPSIAACARRSSRPSTRRRWPSGSASATASPVHEVPVGFKYVGPKMIETGAMMGGEESGGFGFGMHLPERDGIFADLMLLDLFLRERAAGRWPASRRSPTSTRSPGRRATGAWTSTSTGRSTRRSRIASWSSCPSGPRPQLAGRPVVRTQPLSTNDGFKFFADDGSWLLVRFSGTEPLVRVYTEAASSPPWTRTWLPERRIVRGA